MNHLSVSVGNYRSKWEKNDTEAEDKLVDLLLRGSVPCLHFYYVYKLQVLGASTWSLFRIGRLCNFLLLGLVCGIVLKTIARALLVALTFNGFANIFSF